MFSVHKFDDFLVFSFQHRISDFQLLAVVIILSNRKAEVYRERVWSVWYATVQVLRSFDATISSTVTEQLLESGVKVMSNTRVWALVSVAVIVQLYTYKKATAPLPNFCIFSKIIILHPFCCYPGTATSVYCLKPRTDRHAPFPCFSSPLTWLVRNIGIAAKVVATGKLAIRAVEHRQQSGRVAWGPRFGKVGSE